MIPAPFQIDRSVSDLRWRLPVIDDAAVIKLMQRHDVPELLARLLVARDIPADQIDAFLFPKLARDFPDPMRLADMKAAANTVADAIEGGKSVGVFADFDVDGATSSALLIQFFRHLNVPAFVHIPDRLAEGYGPNVPALLGLQAKGTALAILCDCGITAMDVLTDVADHNFPVIVLDHHEPEGMLPPAAHIINPKRRDDSSGYTMLAAVGVTFLFCVAINAVLRERGYFTRGGLNEPPLKNWLDLVALGTICDMVPLTGVNRVLVRAGLSALNARTNIGIQALARVAGIADDEKITPMSCGFGLGPRINAGSRVHEADMGSRLLSSCDPVEAMRLAEILDDCNKKRREMETSTVAQAIRRVEEQGLDRHAVIVVGDETWHPGVAGLVATRLKDKYARPVAVITYTKNGNGVMEGRGSGRSVPGFNIAALFQAAKAAGLVTKGGGHAMAGGFTLTIDQVPGFIAFVQNEGAAMAAEIDATPERMADSLAFVRSLQLEAATILEDSLGPYGQGHEEPCFILPSVRVTRVDIIGTNHVRAQITDWEGGGGIKAMAFRAAETPVGQMLLKAGDAPLHLLGTLRVDRWQGRESPVFFVSDAAKPGQTQENPMFSGSKVA